MPRLRDAYVDLVLGGRCVGCDRPGRILCEACRELLPRGADVHQPTPTPLGLATPYAATAYDGLVRELVVGHKERRLLALRPVLGELLADAVRPALAGVARAPAVLVPVPSRRSSVRARGHDPTLTITVDAARRLAETPGDVTVVRLLRSRGGVLDQAGLDAEQRRSNVAGSMAVDPARLQALARTVGAAHLVVCDDVLTTGSTAREAQRALEAVGLVVLAVAAVAATPRRVPPAGCPGQFMADHQPDRLSLPPGTD